MEAEAAAVTAVAAADMAEAAATEVAAAAVVTDGTRVTALAT